MNEDDDITVGKVVCTPKSVEAQNTDMRQYIYDLERRLKTAEERATKAEEAERWAKATVRSEVLEDVLDDLLEKLVAR